jgi:hypothetical protein
VMQVIPQVKRASADTMMLTSLVISHDSKNDNINVWSTRGRG